MALPLNLYHLWVACFHREKHKPELSCYACFNFSRLHSRSPVLYSDSQASTGLHMVHDIDLHEIFECAHLKFMVNGQFKQACIDTHTHSHNEVTLVWGLLRLTLINYCCGRSYRGVHKVPNQDFQSSDVQSPWTTSFLTRPTGTTHAARWAWGTGLKNVSSLLHQLPHYPSPEHVLETKRTQISPPERTGTR